MRDPLQLAADADLEAITAVARTLQPEPAFARRALLRDEAALLLDGLLVRVARGRGGLDLSIGGGLATLTAGDRLLRLGFSCLGDYARERLGIAGSTAEKLARLARQLSERPLLRDAVQAGAISARKAETIVAVARGEAEAAWVTRARGETVRALALAVRREGSEPGEEEERWERITFAGRPGQPEARARLDEALALAGKLLGATSPRWQRLEAICEEYLGAHPPEELPEASAAGPDRLFDRDPSGRSLEELKGWLEEESRRWSFISSFDPAPLADPGGEVAGGPRSAGTSGCEPVIDLVRLDADLRRLRDLRSRWDELFGHLALLLRMHGLWRELQFASLEHYCTERLGLSVRALTQRVALERRLHWLPALRQAMRDGRVSYEKARIVAAQATEQTLDDWIDRAARLPCIALAREAEAAEEAQMCARGDYAFRLPARVALLLHEALQAAQRVSGRFLTAEEALGQVAAHFIATWAPQLREKNTVQRRVLDRDRGWCQVPGCSRAAHHVHHVRFRSHLGPTVEENLVGLCAAHHLHGVHAGYLRVTGQAPHRLRWSFPPGGGPERYSRSSMARFDMASA